MQDSSAFQYIPIDLIDKSATNPRKTFDPSKLEELAESIRQHGVIQPITVRPKSQRFELVAGERRFLAAQLAEQFSLPAHIKELTDAQAMEWQLVENAQRVDVHPYEEGQGFQCLLDLPGYDVTALVAKSGKSASHIYARLSLLQLIPSIAEAFLAERITTSHANLIARLPQEHQPAAFASCWRKDWQDNEAHLLPAKNLAAWIQSNLYLNLAEAPFDVADASLKPEAGACLTCPRRSGFNTSLFADVQDDQCFDATCYQAKVTAHIDLAVRENPQLVQIETSFCPPKERRPEALNRHQYRVLNVPDNPDAEPVCPHVKSAIVVHGESVGHLASVCVEPRCPVHNPMEAARIAADPPPVMPPAQEDETEEEAAQREEEHQQRVVEYEAEQRHKEEERQAEEQREKEEFEVEQQLRRELWEARKATFERMLTRAPQSFTVAQLRLLLRAFIQCDLDDLLSDVADQLGSSDEDRNQPDQDIVLAALHASPDEEVTRFAIRLALADHVGIPREGAPDLLNEADAVFPSARSVAARVTKPRFPKAKSQKSTPKKAMSKKIAATPKKKLVA